MNFVKPQKIQKLAKARDLRESQTRHHTLRGLRLPGFPTLRLFLILLLIMHRVQGPNFPYIIIFTVLLLELISHRSSKFGPFHLCWVSSRMADQQGTGETSARTYRIITPEKSEKIQKIGSLAANIFNGCEEVGRLVSGRRGSGTSTSHLSMCQERCHRPL